MKYTDYNRLKSGGYQSVGKFGDHIFVYEALTGVTDSPEYHQISQAEFDSFEIWSQEFNTNPKKIYEILNRPVLCSGYRGREELNTSLLQEF